MFKKLIQSLSGKAATPENTQAASPRATTASERSEGQRPRKRKSNKGQTDRKRSTTGEAKPVASKNSVNHTVDTPWDVRQFDVPPAVGKTRFHDLGLPDSLMRAIHELGFSYCSPIQAQALPFTLRGGDVVGKAQTGTGKTAAFLIAIINDLLKNPMEGPRYAGEARAVVLAPTRELAIQIGQDAENLCKYTGLNVHTLVGGMDYQKQKQQVYSKYVDILVATPGRLIDFLESRDIFLDEVECLVIDEADRMLDMGFIPQVKRIVRNTPPKEQRQTLLFSATFNSDVLNLAAQWTCQPAHIEIESTDTSRASIDQRVYMLSNNEKFTFLYNLLQQEQVQSLIVFANRRSDCRHLYEMLRASGVPSGILTGDVDQAKRVKTLERFRAGEMRVLVATDVAGRGIHIDGISHVVNFTLPEASDDYVHRIGRTGRAGATGTSISFASEDDAFLLPEIEKTLGRQLQCEMPPEVYMKAMPEEIAARVEKALQESRRESRKFATNNRQGGSRSQSNSRPRRR